MNSVKMNSLAWIILLPLMAGLAGYAHGDGLPGPPFMKSWCHETGDYIFYHKVCGNAVCYYTSFEYGALDLQSGKALWKKETGEDGFSRHIAMTTGSTWSWNRHNSREKPTLEEG